MDLIESLPKSEGKDYILVVVDRLTKYAHFWPLTHPFSAPIIAKTFLDNIHKLHGTPTCIVSNREKVFTSGFWKELLKLLGTKLHYSTSYHPQTDEQT
jgi:transposase InsO family protein